MSSPATVILAIAVSASGPPGAFGNERIWYSPGATPFSWNEPSGLIMIAILLANPAPTVRITFSMPVAGRPSDDITVPLTRTALAGLSAMTRSFTCCPIPNVNRCASIASATPGKNIGAYAGWLPPSGPSGLFGRHVACR